uniref:Uncharacterized protein n=1 Tax=Arundo donax TaxID=35708 RepID=A0A0A8XXU3_ARUDO
MVSSVGRLDRRPPPLSRCLSSSISAAASASSTSISSSFGALGLGASFSTATESRTSGSATTEATLAVAAGDDADLLLLLRAFSPQATTAAARRATSADAAGAPRRFMGSAAYRIPRWSSSSAGRASILRPGRSARASARKWPGASSISSAAVAGSSTCRTRPSGSTTLVPPAALAIVHDAKLPMALAPRREERW